MSHFSSQTHPVGWQRRGCSLGVELVPADDRHSQCHLSQCLCRARCPCSQTHHIHQHCPRPSVTAIGITASSRHDRSRISVMPRVQLLSLPRASQVSANAFIPPLQASRMDEVPHSLLCCTSRAGQLQPPARQGRVDEGSKPAACHITERKMRLLRRAPRELQKQMAHDLPCSPWILCPSSP